MAASVATAARSRIAPSASMSGIPGRPIWSTIRRSGTNSWRHDRGRWIGGRMDLGLKGKKAVVTGGSKGIGRAIADTFANEGADVALCARNAAELDATVAALKGKGVKAFSRALDVADADALKGWISDAGGELRGIDALVCNV